MLIRPVFIVLVAAIAAAATALAAEISQEDYEFFLEESYGRYWDEGDKANLEDQFYLVAKSSKTPDAAVAAFAKSLDVSVEQAREYAAAIIEAAKFRESCNKDRSPESCAFAPGDAIYDALVGAGYLDKTGGVAVVIGESIPGYGDAPRAAQIAFIRAVVDHPARGRIFTALFDHGKKIVWAAALVALEPPDVERAKLFFEKAASRQLYDASNWNGALMALLEIARDRARHEKNNVEDAYVLYANALILLQLEVGLSADAITTYRKTPRRLRDVLIAPVAALEDAADRDSTDKELGEYAIELAAAMFADGRKRTANRLLQERDELLSATGVKLKLSQSMRLAALKELMSPDRASADVYAMFVNGRKEGDSEPVPDDNDYDMRGRSGWLFALSASTPAFKRAAAGYLQERGYNQMAAYLTDGSLYHRDSNSADPVAALADLMPENFSARKAYWAKRIDSAWRVREETNNAQAESDPGFVYRGPAPVVYEERPLPPAFQRSDDDATAPTEQQIPEDAVLPVDPRQVVRYGEEEGEKLIIYFSGAFESPGEVPAYGYWFQKTRDKGKEWEPALYLGLQQFFPYVVVPQSKMPLLLAGGLNIEVEAREIDPASITFPPVGLALKRQEKNLYLAFNLDALMRDSDEDELTDVIEHRVGLGPQNPDTDGDGLTDGRDSLPLTAYDPDASEADKELAYVILSKLIGYDRGAIVVSPTEPGEKPDIADMLGAFSPPPVESGAVFLVADPRLFAGVRLPLRLFVYNQAGVEKIGDGAAPFYPARVSYIFSKPDGSERYVIWSASWVGGEFIVRCHDGKCETEVTSSWIT